MAIQLRQICLVAHSLNHAVTSLQTVFGINSCFSDSAVKKWGLENNLLSIGNNFLEVVSPIQTGTTAERYLQRRKGDGGYMVICQADSYKSQLAVRQRALKMNIRIAWERKNSHYHLMQLHPADMQSGFLEVDWDKDNDFDGNWEPAGGSAWINSIDQSRTQDFCGIELQCDQPEILADKWARVLGLDAKSCEIELNNAWLRFIPIRDDRGPGISGIGIIVHDRDAVITAAQKHGITCNKSYVEICGVRFYLQTANKNF